jgi:hypothetical protein
LVSGTPSGEIKKTGAGCHEFVKKYRSGQSEPILVGGNKVLKPALRSLAFVAWEQVFLDKFAQLMNGIDLSVLEHVSPIEWTKEEVHQQQMKHSYSNLCN